MTTKDMQGSEPRDREEVERIALPFDFDTDGRRTVRWIVYSHLGILSLFGIASRLAFTRHRAGFHSPLLDSCGELFMGLALLGWFVFPIALILARVSGSVRGRPFFRGLIAEALLCYAQLWMLMPAVQ
ncbi:MAG: hypothetical protein IT428_23265 [Planctomycetaceae bacterium]|nr:hypothetical protein [Planctomycetaceae bacterium]